MLDLIFGFSLKLENLKISVDAKGVSSSGETLFLKPITLSGKSQILDFIRDYVNKNWNPIFKFLQVTEYQHQVKQLELINVRFVVS